MTLSRREMLRTAVWCGGGLVAATGTSAAGRSAAGRSVDGRSVDGRSVDGRSVDELPSVSDPQYLSPIADPLAVPRFVNPLPRPARIDLSTGREQTLTMAPTRQDVLGGGLGLATEVWGFGPDQPTFPGPTLIARAHRSVDVTWINALPYAHLLPVDTTLHWAFAHTDHTIARDGVPAVVHLHGGHTEARGDGHPEAWYTPGGATGPTFTGTRYRYDNDQEAGTLWYHDHTVGLTRLNVYAGLSGFYLLRDDNEHALLRDNRLPHGPREIEIVLHDRMFYPDGRLAFPDLPAAAPQWPGGPSIRPAVYGQVILVNGAAWPRADLAPCQYRFRLLNGSGSRFYRLSVGGSWPFPAYQIGTDGGFLARPLLLDAPLVLGPGERADLVLDLRNAAGREFDLTNDAPTPYPVGRPVAPPADDVLRLRVSQPPESAVPEPLLPDRLRAEPYAVRGPVERTRRLLLAGTTDTYGRPRPLLGTVEQGVRSWADPITEDPVLGTTEVWEVFNTTNTTHPVHLHLVRFQVLDRTPFTATQDAVTGSLSDIELGTPQLPEESELAPKDTVRAPAGQVTRIKAFFDKPGQYVWHCHMLEHEDHEMMRPLQVNAPSVAD